MALMHFCTASAVGPMGVTGAEGFRWLTEPLWVPEVEGPEPGHQLASWAGRPAPWCCVCCLSVLLPSANSRSRFGNL